jgi:hypothetical protein
MLHCLIAALCDLYRYIERRVPLGCPLTMRVRNRASAQAPRKQAGYHEVRRHSAHPSEGVSRVQARPSPLLWHSASAVEDGVLEVVEVVLADDSADGRLRSFASVSVVRVQNESARAGNMSDFYEFASHPVPSIIRQRERGERR